MAVPSSPILTSRQVLVEAARTKAGMVGFGMLIILVAVVIYIPIYAPYDVVSAWGSRQPWLDNPRVAAPEWTDWFTSDRLSRTTIFHPEEFQKSTGCNEAGTFCLINIRRTFEWNFDQFPSETTIRVLASWTEGTAPPLVVAQWERPDGEAITLFGRSPDRRLPDINSYNLAQDDLIRENVRAWAIGFGAEDQSFVRADTTLFAVADKNMLNVTSAQVLKGTYTLRFQIASFSSSDAVDAQFLAFGTIFGWAGTDDKRRDLMVGLLWGAPVALAFGTAAALITVFAQVIFGALGAYYGGRWDEFIQRSTDFALILPVLPVLILIGAFYTPSIWHILLIVVVFSLVGGTTKVIRSIVLQAKEDLYIESAKSYGASRGRILFRYIFPRTLPYTFAIIALAVPGFIFLEAALSFLGLGDPVLPTWGKTLGEAYAGNALFGGAWWWIAFPALGILFVTVAFAFLGYAFDKILNPRLREE